jgi:hypothetical protein
MIWNGRSIAITHSGGKVEPALGLVR